MYFMKSHFFQHWISKLTAGVKELTKYIYLHSPPGAAKGYLDESDSIRNKIIQHKILANNMIHWLIYVHKF